MSKIREGWEWLMWRSPWSHGAAVAGLVWVAMSRFTWALTSEPETLRAGASLAWVLSLMAGCVATSKVFAWQDRDMADHGLRAGPIPQRQARRGVPSFEEITAEVWNDRDRREKEMAREMEMEDDHQDAERYAEGWDDPDDEPCYCACPHHRHGCNAEVDHELDRCPMCEEACPP